MTDYRECDIPTVDDELPADEITLSATVITFQDTVLFKNSKSIELVITNTGSRDFFFKKLTLPKNFKWDLSDVTQGVRSGAKVIIPVWFCPTEIGTLSGDIVIQSVYGGYATCSLVGIGIEATSEDEDSSTDSDNNSSDASVAKELSFWSELSSTNGSIFTPKSSATDVSVILMPKGTGGLYGNNNSSARGKYTIDLQFNNVTSNYYAGGDYSVILGGRNNQTLQELSFIGTGEVNTVDGDHSVIVSGSNNQVTGENSALISAEETTSKGVYNFIGVSNRSTLQGEYSFLGAVYQASVEGNDAFIGAGLSHTVKANTTFIGTGSTNVIEGDITFIGAGNSISSSSEVSAVIVGKSNTLSGGTNNFIGSGSNNTINESDNSFIGSSNGTNINSSNNSAVLVGENNKLYYAASSLVLGGLNNVVSYAEASVILTGSANSISRPGEDTCNYALILTGSGNTIETSDYSFIVSGKGNSIKNSPESSIMTGSNNTIEDGSGVITGGSNNSISSSVASSIDGGEDNYISDSTNASIASGKENIISSSTYSLVGNGYANTVSNASYAGILAGTKNKNSGKEAVIIGGFRNKVSGRNSVALGGSWGSDLGLANHNFRAMRDGIYWSKYIVDESTGTATTEAADTDLSVWTNNNPTFQEGSILLQKMPDPTKGYYTGTEIYKQYFQTQSQKYQEDNIWYNLPTSDESTSITIPDGSCLFWKLEINLVSFTQAKTVQITCKSGSIMNNNSVLTEIRAHSVEVISSDPDLNNCNITLELDTSNNQVKFLLPVELSDFTGGAVLKYVIATQDSTNFYWNE